MGSLEFSPLSIEALMYFGVGFLAAALIAIAMLPVVLNRAERLTRRRVMATIPNSMAEALAEKDSARAMFAVAVRKLEVRTEDLVKRIAAQGAQLGRHGTMNMRLKEALDEKSKLVEALEVREGAMLSRENALIHELLALRDENRKHRDAMVPRDVMVPLRLPPAQSPWEAAVRSLDEARRNPDNVRL